MEILGTKRLDHLGLVMGTFRELGVIELINQKIGQHEQNHITPGEAVAAMVLNGLGFVSRPLTLTPQFFETKALDVLFGKDIKPDDLNRHKLGRVLDDIHAYGCELLFSEIALHACQRIGLDDRFTSIDTSSFCVSGNYDVEEDEREIILTHGYSKDHRPDLKQVVLELVASQDGGIPLMMRCCDGNESDNKIFKERCIELVKSFKQGSPLRYVVGDSKLYHQDNMDHLKHLKFITRIPGVYKAEEAAIFDALEKDCWIPIDDENKYYEQKLSHFGIEQRWFVVCSKAAGERALSTLDRQISKEYQAAERALLHLRNKEFSCEQDAKKQLSELSQTFKYHEIVLDCVTIRDCYEGKGRPKKTDAPTKQVCQVFGKIMCLPEKRQHQLRNRSCYVIGTNATAPELSALEVIEAYKNQNASIERGFRFLKDPQFFVSSFFLKKPSRIMGLLMVMVLSLLIYSVAQRHLRKQLVEQKETLPNQIKQPVQNPTMRWLFQLLEGIDVVYIRLNGSIQRQITGLTPLKEKILLFLFDPVLSIYGLNIKTQIKG